MHYGAWGNCGGLMTILYPVLCLIIIANEIWIELIWNWNIMIWIGIELEDPIRIGIELNLKFHLIWNCI